MLLRWEILRCLSIWKGKCGNEIVGKNLKFDIKKIQSNFGFFVRVYKDSSRFLLDWPTQQIRQKGPLSKRKYN